MLSHDERRFLLTQRVGHLATADDRAIPHVVPVCFTISQATLYITVDEKPKRSPRLKRLANVRSNPAASVLVDAYEEDWSRLWWVRLDGRARVIEGGPERERALALLAGKYAQYRAQLPRGPVLALAIDGWRAWAAADR